MTGEIWSGPNGSANIHVLAISSQFTLLIEAMASSLPVIVLDCGGPSEVVGTTGIKVPVSSAAIAERELAAAIQRFADDPPETRIALAKQSTERVESFSWETQVPRVLDVYEMLYRAN